MNDPQLEPDSPDPETAATLWKTKSGNGIEVSYDPAYWPEESLGHFAQISVKLLDHIDREFALNGVLMVFCCVGDDRIRQLNSQFRAKDRPTNVLSFPSLMMICSVIMRWLRQTSPARISLVKLPLPAKR